MGMFDFIKDAGEKLFGGGDDEAPTPERNLEDVLADKRTSQALHQMIPKMGFEVTDLAVSFRNGKATLKGNVPSQEVREKIVLLTGNTQGVAQVEDLFQVVRLEPEAAPEPEAAMYTVKSGDTLGAIAKRHYDSASKYTVIFEANRPMLKDPNKIYAGQVLRIPPLDS